MAEQTRKDEEDRRIAEWRRFAEEKEKQRAESDRLARDEREAVEKQKGLAAEREAEHQRLTDRLLRLDEERKAKEKLARETPRAPAQTPPPPIAEATPQRDTVMAEQNDDARPAEPRSLLSIAKQPETAPRVTVLLVMDPGTNGIRRYGKKTADPVLCTNANCWIGAGTGTSAKLLPRGRALGSGNTLGQRAAACNHRLTCAFRGMDLKASTAMIQPIDMRIMRHDRREFLEIKADHSCRLARGVLHCDKTFTARTWRAWIVPEALAAEAGTAALEAALASGLPSRPAATLIQTRLQ
jgi:hypothetical protein